MTMRRDRSVEADGDHEQQRADKEVRRDQKSNAGIFDASHVNQRQGEQDEQAERQHVRLQPRKGRHQGTDTSRDTNGGVEDVVDHQRRGGKQAGVVAQVLAGDRVAAAAVGVGLNRLAVAEINDGQQADDGKADGDDVRDSQDTQWNQ